MTCGSQARAARGAPKAEGERGGRIAMRPDGEGRETRGARDPAPQEGRRAGETPALPGRAWEGKGRRQSAAPTREGDGRRVAGAAGACSCPTSLAGSPLIRTLRSGGAHGARGPAGWEGRWAARKGHPGRTKVLPYGEEGAQKRGAGLLACGLRPHGVGVTRGRGAGGAPALPGGIVTPCSRFHAPPKEPGPGGPGPARLLRCVSAASACVPLLPVPQP